ncbi:hypothetical protein GQ472_01865 [archaeon]|nr:hypothetical protein [archaeon]
MTMTNFKLAQKQEDILVDALSNVPLNQIKLSYTDMTSLIHIVRDYGMISRRSEGGKETE